MIEMDGDLIRIHMADENWEQVYDSNESQVFRRKENTSKKKEEKKWK